MLCSSGPLRGSAKCWENPPLTYFSVHSPMLSSSRQRDINMSQCSLILHDGIFYIALQSTCVLIYCIFHFEIATYSVSCTCSVRFYCGGINVNVASYVSFYFSPKIGWKFNESLGESGSLQGLRRYKVRTNKICQLLGIAGYENLVVRVWPVK